MSDYMEEMEKLKNFLKKNYWKKLDVLHCTTKLFLMFVILALIESMLTFWRLHTYFILCWNIMTTSSLQKTIEIHSFFSHF